MFIGGGGGTKPAASPDPGRGMPVGGAEGGGTPTLGGVGGCGWMGIPTGDPPRAVELVMIGPLMTGPPESPELPELTEIMEGAVEILLCRLAGEAGIVHVWSERERERERTCYV